MANHPKYVLLFYICSL